MSLSALRGPSESITKPNNILYSNALGKTYKANTRSCMCAERALLGSKGLSEGLDYPGAKTMAAPQEYANEDGTRFGPRQHHNS